MSGNPESISPTSQLVSDLPPEELQVLKAVRDLQFGVVEIVIHERRITEIRQTRKTRIAGTKTTQN